MAGDNIGRRPLLGLGAALGLAMPALAQQAPAGRPVTLVVPFPPGGSTDVMARLLAERMAPALGQPVLVENRPGAATAIGAEAVARAAPDGYTVLVNSGTTLTINPLVLHHLPYKVEDFAPVSLLSILPFAFLVQNRLPATIPEFVALAKAKPGQLNYGTNGPSSFNNIAAVLVNDALGIRMQDVTYRGDAAQLNDFVAGTLDVLVVGGSSAIQPHRNGQGRIIGWTGDRRMPFMPEIPTFAEYAPAPWRKPISAWRCRRARRARQLSDSAAPPPRHCRTRRCATACWRKANSPSAPRRRNMRPSCGRRPIAGGRSCSG